MTLRKPFNTIRWRMPATKISIQNLHIQQSPSHPFSDNLQVELREPTNQTYVREHPLGLTARLSYQVEAKDLSRGAEHTWSNKILEEDVGRGMKPWNPLYGICFFLGP